MRKSKYAFINKLSDSQIRNLNMAKSINMLVTQNLLERKKMKKLKSKRTSIKIGRKRDTREPRKTLKKKLC
jgi:hypothetical protein